MASTAPTKAPVAVVDASLVIGFCAKETNKYTKAKEKLEYYATNGWELFAPGVLVGEVLYVLCKKRNEGLISSAEYTEAVRNFVALMTQVHQSPLGDMPLAQRAEQILMGYGCARANDSLYIALAERLANDGRTEVITFDEGMKKHSAANAPTVAVEVLGVSKSAS